MTIRWKWNGTPDPSSIAEAIHRMTFVLALNKKHIRGPGGGYTAELYQFETVVGGQPYEAEEIVFTDANFSNEAFSWPGYLPGEDTRLGISDGSNACDANDEKYRKIILACLRVAKRECPEMEYANSGQKR